MSQASSSSSKRTLVDSEHEDENVPAMFKKQKTASAPAEKEELDTAAVMKLSAAALKKKSQTELISYIIALQAYAKAGGKAALSPEDVQLKTEAARKAMVKGIKSQMKWLPSAKKGTAKWNYGAVLPNQEIFKALFPAHKGKICKYTPDEFEAITKEDVSASIRYGSLHITGKTVNCKFDSESCELTVTGTYGLPQY